MKSIISKSVAVAVLSMTLLSFAPKFGGEGFEIYLNNKVVVQQYGSHINTVKSLQLANMSPNDKLSIKYHHCGRVGKNRIVTIKDEQNNVLKEFRFQDVDVPVAAMDMRVKDIMNLKKGTNTIKLFYTSSELPKGRILVSINTGAANMTKL